MENSPSFSVQFSYRKWRSKTLIESCVVVLLPVVWLCCLTAVSRAGGSLEQSLVCCGFLCTLTMRADRVQIGLCRKKGCKCGEYRCKGQRGSLRHFQNNRILRDFAPTCLNAPDAKRIRQNDTMSLEKAIPSCTAANMTLMLSSVGLLPNRSASQPNAHPPITVP